MSWLIFKCPKSEIYIIKDKWKAIRVEIRVFKTDVTQPSCVGCHVGICLNASISSIMTHQLHMSKLTPKKNSLHPSCPHYVWQLKTKLIIIRLTTKFSIFLSLNLVTKIFWSPTFSHRGWQPKHFSRQILVAIINNQMFFNIFDFLKSYPKNFHHSIDTNHWSNNEMFLIIAQKKLDYALLFA